MTAPKGLGASGKALWKAVLADLPRGWELDHRELQLLTLACRQADDIALLEQSIKKTGAMAIGSQGQDVVNPAISEVRQGRHAVARLLGQIELPNADEQPATHASTRARHAARSRWSKEKGMARG